VDVVSRDITTGVFSSAIANGEMGSALTLGSSSKSLSENKEIFFKFLFDEIRKTACEKTLNVRVARNIFV